MTTLLLFRASANTSLHDVDSRDLDAAFARTAKEGGVLEVGAHSRKRRARIVARRDFECARELKAHDDA